MNQVHRTLLVGTLLAAIVAVVLLTASVLGKRYYPEWRERCIALAVKENHEPAFWWPSSWRGEYKVRQELRRAEERLNVFQFYINVFDSPAESVVDADDELAPVTEDITEEARPETQ